jgi:hypothetical protein
MASRLEGPRRSGALSSGGDYGHGIVAGLRLAAQTGRHQAGICRHAYGSTNDADAVESFCKTLEAMATQEETRLDDEVTQPRIESVKCPYCGTEILVRRPG